MRTSLLLMLTQMRCVVLLTGALVLLSLGTCCSLAAELSATNGPSRPPELTLTYVDTNGVEHLYLAQEPQVRPIPADTPILIFMHGKGGKEEQGMRKLFPGLRELLDGRGWIYVCPRDGEFEGLRCELVRRYGERTLYLSGASAGGRAALREALQHPAAYAGLILMCPALAPEKLPTFKSDASLLPMPLWMICGEMDLDFAATCRALQAVLTNRQQAVHYFEIPGGDHNAPCSKINWEEALRFVSEAAGTNRPPAAATPEQPGGKASQ